MGRSSCCWRVGVLLPRAAAAPAPFHASRTMAWLCGAHWPPQRPPWCLETSKKDSLSFWVSQEQLSCHPPPSPHATAEALFSAAGDFSSTLKESMFESQVELLVLDHIVECFDLWVKLTRNYMLLQTPSSTALNFFPSLFKLECQRWHPNCWLVVGFF